MAVFVISLGLLLVLGLPIAATLGLSALSIFPIARLPLSMLSQRLFSGLDLGTLLAIPFFVFAGMVMQVGGLSRRIVSCASAFFGSGSGGFALVTIVASMFFSAVSGSGAATAAAIGAIMIPAMTRQGYDPAFAASTQAAAAELGVIIPPSVSMILFCAATNTPVSDMFIAGLLPGLLIGLSLMLTAWRVCRGRGYAGQPRPGRKARLRSVREAALALLMPLIVLGGIYGGVFTATEAAVVAAAYALLVSGLIYKELSWADLRQALRSTVLMMGVVMSILAAAGVFAYVLTINSVPRQVADLFISLSHSKLVFLLLINLLLLVVGMFFDGAPAMIVLAPILLPAAVAFGLEPVHFGIIMVCNLALGMITPPFAVNLYVSAQISGSGVGQMLPYVGLYTLTVLLDLLLISFLPQLSLVLPGLIA